MRYVNKKDLRPGMILANNIYDNHEQILLKGNTSLTQSYIDRIIKLGYDGLYIFDEGDVVKANQLISDETRIAAINKLKKLDIDACLFLANKIVNEVQNSESLIVETINLSSYDNYTYVHSVNVDLLSVIIGIGMGLRNAELEKLSQAALLHDIGKCDVPIEILNKPAKLTKEEYEEIKRHPEYGLRRLREKEKNGDEIPSVIKSAVYSHHENWDGSGYPRGISGRNIHKFARIIHVADVYDALTGKRSYKDAMNPADAMEYMMANSGIMFDIDVVNIFVQYIAPYPLGSNVLLSSGKQGVVCENNEKSLSRPKVRLANGNIIDLYEKLDVTIIKILT